MYIYIYTVGSASILLLRLMQSNSLLPNFPISMLHSGFSIMLNTTICKYIEQN